MRDPKTEQIDVTTRVKRVIDEYAEQIVDHPIARACSEQRVPKDILQAFAKCQFVDGTTWVAMLALAQGNARSPVLREAIRKNIRDEVGDSNTPHVTMCRDFVRSVGVQTTYSDVAAYSPASVYPVGLMFGLAGNSTDGLMAGWLLAQEVLVPVVFRTFRPAFAVFPSADLTYLREHEEVDTNHSRWIEEALSSVALDIKSGDEALAGAHMGCRATIAVLDHLYGQMIQLRS